MLVVLTFDLVIDESLSDLYLGSQLYYMNQDGGLSSFDVNTGLTIETLDNTTFVSIMSCKASCYFLSLISLVYTISLSVCILETRQTQIIF